MVTMRSSNTDELRAEMNGRQLAYMIPPNFARANSRGGARIPSNGPGGEFNVAASNYVTRCGYMGDCAERPVPSQHAAGILGGHGPTQYPESSMKVKAALNREMNEWNLRRFGMHDLVSDMAEEALQYNKPHIIRRAGPGPMLPINTREERYVLM